MQALKSIVSSLAPGLAPGLALCVAAAGCGVSADDDSMYLTGSEEHAITLADGTKACENPKKVLVCHIPPGNPDNAHDICVGAPAVAAHQENHGDTLGPCEPPPDGDDDGDGDGDGGTIP